MAGLNLEISIEMMRRRSEPNPKLVSSTSLVPDLYELLKGAAPSLLPLVFVLEALQATITNEAVQRVVLLHVVITPWSFNKYIAMNPWSASSRQP